MKYISCYSDGNEVTIAIHDAAPKSIGIFEISPNNQVLVDTYGWAEIQEGKHKLVYFKEGLWKCQHM